MSTRKGCFFVGVLLSALQLHCQKPSVAERYEFVFRVESDPGKPLANAQILLGGKKLGRSNEAGVVTLGAHGSEGEELHFHVECPQGYASPEQPTAVLLRRATDRSKRPEYPVTCSPTKRTVVVAIRAVNGPNLPVRYLGQEVARTDSNGAAHVVLHTAPSEDIQLTIDTSANQRLKPQNPSVRFQTRHQDEIFLLDQEFSVLAAPKTIRRSVPKRSGPVPI
jgi:hypothetical protein